MHFDLGVESFFIPHSQASSYFQSFIFDTAIWEEHEILTLVYSYVFQEIAHRISAEQQWLMSLHSKYGMYTWKALPCCVCTYLWRCWHDLSNSLLLALGTNFCGCTVSLLCCILWSPYCAWPITPHNRNTKRTRRSVNSCIVFIRVIAPHFCSINASAFYSACKAIKKVLIFS